MQHLAVHLTAALTSLLIHPVPVHYPVTVPTNHTDSAVDIKLKYSLMSQLVGATMPY